jgi:hypothetical protein
MPTGDSRASADRDFVAELCRWEDSGAGWQIVARTKSRVTIALMRCDGGEEVDRFTSDDPKVLEFVTARQRSLKPWE